MAELLIRKKRIISNLNKLKEYSPNNIYVLKANAYGLGIENIVSILKEQNEDFFAVSNIEEAMRVRKIDSECRVLILGDVDKKDIDLVKTYNFEPTLFSQKQMEKYRGLRVHVSFNTGLNRLGFDKLVDFPKIFDNCCIFNGLFSPIISFPFILHCPAIVNNCIHILKYISPSRSFNNNATFLFEKIFVLSLSHDTSAIPPFTFLSIN